MADPLSPAGHLLDLQSEPSLPPAEGNTELCVSLCSSYLLGTGSAAAQGCTWQNKCPAVLNCRIFPRTLSIGILMVVLNSTKGKCELSCFLNALAQCVPFFQFPVLQHNNKQTYRGILLNHCPCDDRLCPVVTALKEVQIIRLKEYYG
ncbi:uncharacterized protein C3orf18 homolog isoform X2 [Parus major]|uniref:uncharacterized protein C3orf18 homolog isoform X2 n=1 Tax=Parus major TaxID=9157 RepID=UPI00077139B1|nr:uncharacterized protein C3orf18 homolog isoform X2 [Parus major]